MTWRAAVLEAIVMLAVGAQTARAGTYVMRSCDVPGHDHALMAPWHAQQTVAGLTIGDECGTGGGVSFVTNGQMAAGNATIIVDKPPGFQSSISFVKAVVWYAARLAGSGQPMQFHMSYQHLDGPSSLGLVNLAPGSENVVGEQLLTPDTRGMQIGIHCGPFDGVQNGEPCFPANSTPLLIRGMEVTLSEEVPPIVSQPEGTLLAVGSQAGVRTLSYAASDPQSGIARVDVLLDETIVASHDLTTRCVNADFTICPASVDETLQVDTRAVPNGTRALALRVRDAAGNERLVRAPTPVDVANPERYASTAATHSLTAAFKGSTRANLVAPFGRRVSIVGRLSGPDGPAPAGMLVDVLERLDRGKAVEVSAARLTTGADGSFAYAPPTDRPSRAIRVVYRGSDGTQVASRILRLRVRAAATLRASLRGQVIRFSGRVRSRPIPSQGKTIRMEGQAPGSAWTSFRSLRTDRRGRFSGTYRLRIRRPGVKLKVRAFVPAQGGYMYASARSPAVILRVR